MVLHLIIETQGILALEKEAAQTHVFMHSLSVKLNTVNQRAPSYYYP